MTPETVEAITDALSIGSSYELAALYAKISPACMENWLRQGRDARKKQEAGEKLSAKEKRFLDFLRKVDEANGEAGIRWQTVVDKATAIDPNMALNMLRLRFSGYSERAQVLYTAPIDMTKLNDEQLQRIAAGENPADVLATPGTGGVGAAQAPGQPG